MFEFLKPKKKDAQELAKELQNVRMQRLEAQGIASLQSKIMDEKRMLQQAKATSMQASPFGSFIKGVDKYGKALASKYQEDDKRRKPNKELVIGF